MRLPHALSIVVFLLSGLLAHATNAILTWNDEVLNATRLGRNPPPIASLHMATYHAALFDAVNGIEGGYQPWLVKEKAPEGANVDAAIASAAHTVLIALWGNTSNPRNFDIAYERALSAIPEGKSRDDGIAWGKKVAGMILDERAKSGWNKTSDGVYTSTQMGKWRETPTGFRPPVAPHLINTIPFVMTSPSQFRAPPPPAVDSKEYADDVNFVAKVGARDDAERTEYQTLSTPFWADDLGTATPGGHWNVIAQDLARRHKLNLNQCARLFALLNFACADAGISCWDTKFFYSSWRPETAIREATKETLPLINANPDWIPNMGAPAHPDYTSGHSTFTGAATRLLERWFGTDDIEFTTNSDGLPGAVRTFKKLSDARREVGMSRVYGGIHTMAANLAGQEAGMKLADWVFEKALQPQK